MRSWWPKDNSDEENQSAGGASSNCCIQQMYNRIKVLFKPTQTNEEDASLHEHLNGTSQQLPEYYNRQQKLINSTDLQPTTGCCYYIKEDTSLDGLKTLMETRLAHNKELEAIDSTANNTIIALGTFLFVEINAYRPLIEEELKKTPTCSEWLVFTPLIVMFIVFTAVLCMVAYRRLTNTFFGDEFNDFKEADMLADMHRLLKDDLEVPIAQLANLALGDDQERKLKAMVYICRVIKAPRQKLAKLYKGSVIVAGVVVVAFLSFEVGRGLLVLCQQ